MLDERAVPVALVEAEDLLRGGETLRKITAVPVPTAICADEGVDDQVVAGGSERGDALMVGGEVEGVVDVRLVEVGPVLNADAPPGDMLEGAAFGEEVAEELSVAVGLSVPVGDLGEEAMDLRDRPEADQLIGAAVRLSLGDLDRILLVSVGCKEDELANDLDDRPLITGSSVWKVPRALRAGAATART